MKVEIQAGAKFDIATRDEVREEINAARASWLEEVARGDRFVSYAAFGDIATGAVTVDDDRMGPRPGFAWSVKRITITNYDPTTDTLVIYRNDDEASSSLVVAPAETTFVPDNGIVLYPGDHLVVAGTAGGTGRVWVSVQAREVPLALAWRL